MKCPVFKDTTPCDPVKLTTFLKQVFCMALSSALTMKATRCSETVIGFQRTAPYYISKYKNFT
jgi:hypothetical protein